MSRAIQLAGYALKTSPNPQVGAVLCEGTKTLAAGFHLAAGSPHAEAEVLNQLKKIPKNATLYVTLEPCCHTDKKTPPCTQAILEKGIKRVVVGCLDPNPKVQGKGLRFLRSKGIQVEVGCLKEECEILIRPFKKWILTHQPYVILKSAITLDGKIADASGKSKWITGTSSREKVQALRASVDAILVGTATALKDNPELTVKNSEVQNPVRIILDASLKLSLNLNIFKNQKLAPTILAVSKSQAKSSKIKKLQALGIDLIFCAQEKNGRLDWSDLLDQLGKKGFAKLLVEGGAAINSSLMQQDLVDEYQVFIAAKIMGGRGLQVFQDLNISHLEQNIAFKIEEFDRIGEDIWLRMFPCLPD